MTAPIRQLGDRPDRAVTRCPGCGEDVLVWFRTDGNGRLLEEAERCGCEESQPIRKDGRGC